MSTTSLTILNYVHVTEHLIIKKERPLIEESMHSLLSLHITKNGNYSKTNSSIFTKLGMMYDVAAEDRPIYKKNG